MINLVLLAENRLSLPTDDRVTPLRIGFLAQFLLIAGWTLSFVNASPAEAKSARTRSECFGGLHLALVAIFAVTEGLVVPRRVRLRDDVLVAMALAARDVPARRRARRRLRARADGGAAAGRAGCSIHRATNLRWFLAPVRIYLLLHRRADRRRGGRWRPTSAALDPVARRRAVCCCRSRCCCRTSLYYVVWQPEVLDLTFCARHLFNPFRTLANWSFVEIAALVRRCRSRMGLTGLLSYRGADPRSAGE